MPCANIDLSIITVNTHDGEKILSQIQSVLEHGKNISLEQFVSDNGSTDGSIEMIRKRFPGVKIIENRKNLGFGAANNAPLPWVNGRYLLFLNPDMRVLAKTLETMISWMNNHPEVGIASCKLISEDGTFNEATRPRRFPALFSQIAILLKLPHIFPHITDFYLMSDFNPENEQQVDSVRGSFLMMRRELVTKLGWAFDPRYFIWFEDVDICRECYRLGYTVYYTPTARCIDYVGQTFRRLSTFQKQQWFTESMLKYFQKWEPWRKWIWIAVLRPFALVTAWAYEKIKILFYAETFGQSRRV
jgi:GT2 family glycosyltransferase